MAYCAVILITLPFSGTNDEDIPQKPYLSRSTSTEVTFAEFPLG